MIRTIALLALLAVVVVSQVGCVGPFEADRHWQTNPYGAKQFWEDRDRRSGGSAE